MSSRCRPSVKFLVLLLLTACATEPKPAPAPAPARDAWYEENPPMADHVVVTGAAPVATNDIIGTGRYGTISTGTEHEGTQDPPRFRSPARATVDALAITGDIDHDDVRRKLQQKADAFAGCEPPMKSVVTATFAILGNGTPSSIDVTATPPAFKQCLVSVLAQITFKHPTGIATVSAPIDFTPAYEPDEWRP